MYSSFSVGANDFPLQIILDTLCGNECFQLRDTCFSEAGMHSGLAEDIDNDSCVFNVNVSLFGGAIPSPNVECQSVDNGLFVTWGAVRNATEYIVFVNRDSFDTVTGQSYLIETQDLDSIINIKIQPRGICDYLPGELNCDPSLSSSKEDSSNNKITIFPNPTTGKISIETDLQIEEIEIYDAAGRFLQKEKSTSFNLKKSKTWNLFFENKNK